MKNRNLILLLLFSAFFGFAVKAQNLQEGMKALDYENFASAKSIFKKLISQQPSEAKNYYYLGQGYSALGQKDSARIVYNTGVSSDSKSIYNYIGLGETYLDENNPQKANEYFNKAKDITSSKDINQYLLLANAYTMNSHPDCQQAINLLNKATEYNNKNADVYYQLGQAHECLNRGGEAVSAYERAGELNPAYAKAYTRVGVIWRLARNYNQALTAFQKAVAIDPNFPPAYREMAELYFYTGQFDVASQTYQKYLDLADKDDYTQFRYAQYLFLTKDYEGALKILNPLRDKMDQPIMWRLSAYSNYEMGNYPVGMEQINTFFQKSQSTRILSSDYEYLGKLMAKSGQDSLAMMNFQKAIEMDSSKISLYNEIGNNLFQQKKYHEAALAYKKKIDAAPKDATLQDYFNVGKSFYFSKEFPQADSAFSSMIELNPQWPIGYIWRARVMTNLDDPAAVKGLAAPFYETVVVKSMADTVKYNKELIEAYKYLGDINALRENYGASLFYYEKFLRLDSANTEVPKTVESVKSLYKNTASSVITLEKDTQGLYLIPGFINNTPVSFILDPAASGISVKQEAAAQLLGNANGETLHTVDQVKIANRSLKNQDITVIANLTGPAVIGADALNKLNIVIDYSKGSLLLK